MKRVLISIMAILLSLICLFSFAACDSNKVDESIFIFKSGKVEIKLGADAKPVIESLGEYKDKSSNGNCGGLGESTKYVYSGFILYTLTDSKGKEVIDQIDFTNDLTETPKGICIGASAEEVKKAYGTPTVEESKLIEYSSGSNFLAFDLDKEGNVDAITYGVRS